jgi:hypothetical protein
MFYWNRTPIVQSDRSPYLSAMLAHTREAKSFITKDLTYWNRTPIVQSDRSPYLSAMLDHTTEAKAS